MKHTLFASLVLASTAFAQTQITIDSTGVGCNDGTNLLSNGSQASAGVTFTYDARSAQLQIVVSNTTTGLFDTTPVITRVYFNAPSGTIDTVALLSQTAPGTTQPNFKLDFDPNAADGNDPIRAGCLGSFNFRLFSAGIDDGIAAPETNICSGSKSLPLFGPATFVLQLTGPEVHNLTSEVFGASSSHNVGSGTVNVAVKFDGADCQGFGTIGNGDVCRTAVFVRGTPQLGNTILLCAEGAHKCRSFLGVSDTDGPSGLKTFALPIGLPVLFTYDFGYFPVDTNEFCLPIFIPYWPELIGMPVFMTSLTHPWLAEDVGPFDFAAPYHFSVSGELPN